MSIRVIRGYGKSAAIAATGYFGENMLFVLQHVISLLRIIAMLSIWRIVFSDRGEVGGMTLASVMTYTVVSSAFGGLLSFGTSLAQESGTSEFAARFTRPLNVVGQYIAETLGGWSLHFCMFSLPLLAIALLMGIRVTPAHLSSLLWFVLSLVLAVSVGAAIDLIFGSVAIWFGNGGYSVGKLRGAITVLLSGALLPLSLMPWGIGHIFAWLPFASMASAPLRIFTCTGDPMLLVGIQLGWCIALWPIAIAVWRAQRERLVTYGG